MPRLRIRDFVRSGPMYLASASYRREGPFDLVPRYVEDPSGNRDGYRKLEGRGIREVPSDEVDEVLRPDGAELRGPAARVRDLLAGEGVDTSRVGVTGSRLLGFETEGSDVDMVIYGRGSFDDARSACVGLVEGGELSGLDTDDWERVYQKRSPELGFDEFVAHERRKDNRFLMGGKLLDLLFVRYWDEVDWELHRVTGKEVIGKAVVTGRVEDDEFSFDSPAIYGVDGDVEVVYSFTHTYAGQAREGERIEARGLLLEGGEELLVGSSRKAEGEYIRALSL